MAINCAALTENLLESELFGHEKGAFTGASERKLGRLELCAGGTFFLDEIGELRAELQAKLLRVLQEKSFERVGGAQKLKAEVRWVAATNRDLRAMIEEGTFREDLYHRLAIFPIRIPGLRDRKEDLVPLAKDLLQDVARGMGRTGLALDTEAVEKVASYSWPGNVRELRNTLERACILAEGQSISASDIWLDHDLADKLGTGLQGGKSERKLQKLVDMEKNAIASALAEMGGNRRQAAEALGIAERTLYDKIKKYAL